MIVGKGTQYFQEPLFHANARLYAFNDVFFHLVPLYQDNMVTGDELFRAERRSGGWTYTLCVFPRGKKFRDAEFMQ